jgi:excinuclease ABC subunit A
MRLHEDSESEVTRRTVRRFLAMKTCRVCLGLRLKPEILAITIPHPDRPASIQDFCALSIEDASDWLAQVPLTESQAKFATDLVREISHRLGFLHEVGLGYLTLNRESATLSGGEGQRIRLATQLGASLAGVLYVLDEPSIGLHQADNEKLIQTLLRLRDLGNSIIVVEHDEETMRAADHLIDMGPGAGPAGGRILAQGTPEEVAQNPDSITGPYLSGRVTRRETETGTEPRNRKTPPFPQAVARATSSRNSARTDAGATASAGSVTARVSQRAHRQERDKAASVRTPALRRARLHRRTR